MEWCRCCGGMSPELYTTRSPLPPPPLLSGWDPTVRGKNSPLSSPFCDWTKNQTLNGIRNASSTSLPSFNKVKCQFLCYVYCLVLISKRVRYCEPVDETVNNYFLTPLLHHRRCLGANARGLGTIGCILSSSSSPP